MIRFFLLFLFCAHSLSAMNKDANVQVEVDVDDTDDGWYGPGFYYGVWFGNEDDYWYWRNQHNNYPPSHRYYHPSHPVPYEGGGHGEGGGRGEGGGHSGGGGHR